MNKKNLTIYLISGIPASGKSTYARELAATTGALYISRDEIRFSMLKDGEDYFAHEDEVMDSFIEQIQESINSRHNCIADATHLNYSSRVKVLNRLDLKNAKVILVIMDTPLAVCMARNAKRDGLARVPDSVIKKMWERHRGPDAEEAKRYAQIKRIKEAKYDE